MQPFRNHCVSSAISSLLLALALLFWLPVWVGLVGQAPDLMHVRLWRANDPLNTPMVLVYFILALCVYLLVFVALSLLPLVLRRRPAP